MAKHCIFFVHGMGEQASNWAEDAIKALSTSYDAIAPGKNFFADFDVVPLRYAEHFQGYWNNYNSRQKALEVLQLPAGKIPGIVEAVLKIASTEAGGSKWLTHWADVALYAATDFNASVPINLWKDLINEWNELNGDRDEPNFSIIAHSLGTRIVHDMLQRAYSDKLSYNYFGKPKALLLAANATRLMSFDDDEFTGFAYKVFPTFQPDNGVCTYLITARHEVDPVASLRPYKLEQSKLDPAYRHQNFYKVKIDWKDFNSKDVHALSHYLAHPNVYSPFFNSSLAASRYAGKIVSAQRQTELLAGYKAKSKIGAVEADVQSVRDSIRSIDLSGSFRGALDEIRGIKDKLEDIAGRIT